MSKWVLLLAIAVAVTMSAFAKDKDKDKDDQSANIQQQIKTLTEQNRDAALKGDTAWMQQHLDPRYVAVGANGNLSTRDQMIQRVKSGAVKYDAIDIQDQKIHVFGNTAVVDTQAHVKATANGQPIDGEFRATHVWAKEGNNWKLVSFQATPVQGATSGGAKK